MAVPMPRELKTFEQAMATLRTDILDAFIKGPNGAPCLGVRRTPSRAHTNAGALWRVRLRRFC